MLKIQPAVIPLFDKLTGVLASEVLPNGWFAAPDSPNTLPDLEKFWRANPGRLHVSDFVPATTVFSDMPGLLAFRGWHDEIHLDPLVRGSFDLPGELRTAQAHVADMARLTGDTPELRAMSALALAQVYDQNVYFGALKGEGRVIDERQFALDKLSGWQDYSDRLLNYLFKWVRTGCPLNRALALSFVGDLPTFGGQFDPLGGYRV